MLLNQRRLKGLPKRGNHDLALHLIAECYPHLSIPKETIESNSTFTWSYDALLSILESNATESRLGDEMVIIDGRFLTAAIDKLQSSSESVRLSLNLLRLSLDGVVHNRRIRQHELEGQTSDEKKVSRQNAHDANELRQIYKSIISFVGRTDTISVPVASRLVLHLLHVHMTSTAQIQPGTEIYHAALNALGMRGKDSEVLDLLGAMEQSFEIGVTMQSAETSINKRSNDTFSCAHQCPYVDKMSYQTAISSLSKIGSIETAISILYRMQSKGFLPDINCYNVVLIGIAKAAGRASSVKNSEARWHQAALKILEEMQNQGLRPTEQVYNSVIAACAKEGAWSEAAMIEQKEKGMNGQPPYNSRLGTKKERHNIESSDRNVENTRIMNNLTVVYFKDLECYEKVGKGKDSWWKIGQCTRTDESVIFIGLKPHKNPVRNGLSLVFYDEKSGFKLGRMLLKNSSSKRREHQYKDILYSSIVGMEVAKSLRGQGLSKIFVAIWLRICLMIDAYPRAALMNKPLISLVLMQFGFVPQEGGTCCELIQLDNKCSCIGDNKNDADGYTPTFGLYSSSTRSLQGVFSDRVLRTQHMAILNHIPQSARNKRFTIYIKTTFEHLIAISENAVDYNPPKEKEPELKRSLNISTKWDATQREVLESQVRQVLPDDQLNFFASHSDLLFAFSRFTSQ